MNREKVKAIIFALAAALFYALNVPFSKILLTHMAPTFQAGFLYLGAGVGVGIIYAFRYKNEAKAKRLTKSDLPYTIGMIVLDIIAPILLMIGVNIGASSGASLLGNFEIAATAFIALIVFKENVSKRLWLAIALIILSSILLTFNGSTMEISLGSVFVLCATVCWGLENNCTRQISDKSTYQIVTLKGICSGIGSLIIAFVISESVSELKYILLTMLLGFVAYGLSIFTYIRAQKTLGAAKTSAYYAVAPFISVFLSFVILKEQLTVNFLISLLIMVLGTGIIIYDTLLYSHTHEHTHILTHFHNGLMHKHIIVHSHSHNHIVPNGNHIHTHSQNALEKYLTNHTTKQE